MKEKHATKWRISCSHRGLNSVRAKVHASQERHSPLFPSLFLPLTFIALALSLRSVRTFSSESCSALHSS